MAGSSEERTEKPTAKRLKDLRKKNTVLRSQELVTTVGLVAVVVFAPMIIMNMWTTGLTVVRSALLAAGTPSAPLGLQVLAESFQAFLSGLILPVAGVLLAVYLASVVFTRGIPNPYAIKPKFELLNPKQGIKGSSRQGKAS